MKIDLKKEVLLFIESLGAVRLKSISRQKIIQELLSNGVAALVAVFVYKLIHSFFKVDSNIKYGLKKTFVPSKIKATEISQNEFDWIMDWIGNPIIFVLSLLVFSLVEQVMETYFEKRKL